MSGSLVAVWSLIGLVVGVGVAAIAARLPDPARLSGAVVAAIAIVNAIAWGIVASTWDRWWQVLPYSALAATLVCVSAIDLRVYRIPNLVVFPALGGSLLLLLVATWQLPTIDAWEFYRGGLVGGAIYFGLLFLPHLIYPKGMGMGDVKLALVMGLYLGWGRSTLDAFGLVAAALFIGCALGVVFGLVVNVVRKTGGAFLFGPSLAIGTFVTLLRATGTPL